MPSSIESVTSAKKKSASVIGYSTAPKQLWPATIGVQGRGWFTHTGGPTRGGMIWIAAATTDCTRPAPRAKLWRPNAADGRRVAVLGLSTAVPMSSKDFE